MTTATDIDHELAAPIQFIVRCNRSLSWQENKIFILYISVLSFGIAGAFALQGLWLVLPFAGIEIIALTTGLYLCCLRNRHQEVITIDEKVLTIEKGTQQPQEIWKYDRAWANVELQKAKFQGHPSKLFIRAKGKQTEVGKLLTNKERKSLANSLSKTLNTVVIKS